MTPPPTLHEVHDRRLKELLSQVIAAELPAIILDQATAEWWLLRLAGVLPGVDQRHRVDAAGQCCNAAPRACTRVGGGPGGPARPAPSNSRFSHFLRDAEPLVFPREDRGAS
jgi:hypothetical protein